MLGARDLTYELWGHTIDPITKTQQTENQDCQFHFWPICWVTSAAGSFPREPPWRNQREKQRTWEEPPEWLGEDLDWGGWGMTGIWGRSCSPWLQEDKPEGGDIGFQSLVFPTIALRQTAPNSTIQLRPLVRMLSGIKPGQGKSYVFVWCWKSRGALTDLREADLKER